MGKVFAVQKNAEEEGAARSDVLQKAQSGQAQVAGGEDECPQKYGRNHPGTDKEQINARSESSNGPRPYPRLPEQRPPRHRAENQGFPEYPGQRLNPYLFSDQSVQPEAQGQHQSHPWNMTVVDDQVPHSEAGKGDGRDLHRPQLVPAEQAPQAKKENKAAYTPDLEEEEVILISEKSEGET